MNTEVPVFRKCKIWWRGGYYIKVTNAMNSYKPLHKRHVTLEEKQDYEQRFGHTILNDREFMTWYLNFGKRKKKQ